jgi:hypothetical protein
MDMEIEIEIEILGIFGGTDCHSHGACALPHSKRTTRTPTTASSLARGGHVKGVSFAHGHDDYARAQQHDHNDHSLSQHTARSSRGNVEIISGNDLSLSLSLQPSPTISTTTAPFHTPSGSWRAKS